MTIGKQVLAARNQQKLTQDQLKSKAGISLDTLRRIEKDKSKNPSHFVITSIEKALNIKLII